MEYMERSQWLDEVKAEKMKQAREVLELYLSGITPADIAKQRGCSIITINRYFKALGGLSPKWRATHAYNRFVK